MSDQNPDEDPSVSKANDDFMHLFDEMNDLLQFALDNSDSTVKGILPKNLEDQLTKLEHDVDEFCRLNEAIINKKDKPLIDPLLTMTRRERAIYDRSKNLTAKAEEKVEVIKQFLNSFSSRGAINKELTPEQRKKKFKGFGTRDKWKRM